MRQLINKIKFELQFNNTHYYTRVSEKLLKKIYKKILQQKINKLHPIQLDSNNAKLTIGMLANSRNFYESVAAIYSFCFWNNNVAVHYHEDGTLTEKQIDHLENIFKGIIVYRRAEQDVKVYTALTNSGLTHCFLLRKQFIFALRLFDMIIEKETKYLMQIDSDVLFFSEPEEIINIIEKGDQNGCYNADLPSSVNTFKDDVIAKYITLPHSEQFNAGLFMHNFDEQLFKFIEPILANEPDCFESWHLEQSLFAMYTAYKGSFLKLPKQYDLARKERALGNKLTSEHYVHSTGYDFHKDFIYKLYPLFKTKS